METRFLRKYDGKKFEWFKDAKFFVIVFVIVFIFFRVIIGFSKVNGHSMESTLMADEFLIYTRVSTGFEVGDIVSVRIPDGDYYVKRIIAKEGDTVNITDGKVYVNDILLDEDYLDEGTITERTSADVPYPYTVGPGQVFVLGDNREVSNDSRSFGAIGNAQIRGKIRFVGSGANLRNPYKK